jgi:hypothetical protein
MNADTLASSAMLTLPLLCGVIAARIVDRRAYLRHALRAERARRDWVRNGCQEWRRSYRNARRRYRHARRNAIANRYRTGRRHK